jgi:hypothetical protein
MLRFASGHGVSAGKRPAEARTPVAPARFHQRANAEVSTASRGSVCETEVALSTAEGSKLRQGPRRGGLGPLGFAPGDLGPEGLDPGGRGPDGPEPGDRGEENLDPGGLGPDGLEPGGLGPEGFARAGLGSEGMVRGGVEPTSLGPAGRAPAGLGLENLDPEDRVLEGLRWSLRRATGLGRGTGACTTAAFAGVISSNSRFPTRT